MQNLEACDPDETGEYPMGSAQILRNLQARQREHDIRAHPDIYYLSYPDRMKHLTFHVSKYAGRLAKDNVPEADLNRTLVDTFIISLSSADVLRIDFTQALNKWTKLADQPDLISLGRAICERDRKFEVLQDWYFRKLADVAGRMAKACESLDHMEGIPYRDILAEAIIDLCRVTIVAASIASLDLAAAVGQRWEYIELHRIL